MFGPRDSRIILWDSLKLFFDPYLSYSIGVEGEVLAPGFYNLTFS